MTSARRPGINHDGMSLAGKALNPGTVIINDCTRDEPQMIGMLRGKLTLMPTPGGEFNIYFDEEIEVNNPSLDEVKTYQLNYHAPNGDYLGSSYPFDLQPHGSQEIPSPHSV